MSKHWWDEERQFFPGPYNSGDLVPGVVCPSCGGLVLYSGNYFCEDFGYEDASGRDGGPCDWALAHPAESEADKKICDTLGIDYE